MTNAATRTAPRFWILDMGTDGIDILDDAMLEDFFRDNEECMIEFERESIRQMDQDPGILFEFGGGAQPVSTIRRATADEVKEGGF